jgi:hypothetical protein
MDNVVDQVHHGPMATRTEGTRARRHAHWSMAFGSARASLELRRRCGDRATVGRCSCYERGERVQWGGAVRAGALIALL